MMHTYIPSLLPLSFQYTNRSGHLSCLSGVREKGKGKGGQRCEGGAKGGKKGRSGRYLVRLLAAWPGVWTKIIEFERIRNISLIC